MNNEKKIENLEKRVNYLYEMINRNQFYTDADIAGTKQNIQELTPWIASKTAYIGDTEITFYDVPDGNVSVFIGGYSGNYAVNRVQDRLTVSFDELNDQTDITISIN